MTLLSAEARKWGALADTSARSVLVTVLGDTVAPLGGEIWLADLFELSQPFGFNQRLVRTSMYRLASEGWVENERVGRRSRYRLTPYAARETAEAERRIYQRNFPNWDEVWSLVLTRTALSDDRHDNRLARHLRWHGFVEIAAGVWAVPGWERAATDALIDRLELDEPPPVALARFDRLDELVRRGLFRSSYSLADTEKAYQGFIDRYRPIARSLLGPADTGGVDIDPVEAFALRTMVVHDLRRARLSDPDLPEVLLPEGWVGAEGFQLAARLYQAIEERAWRAVAELTDLDPTCGDDRLASRFRR